MTPDLLQMLGNFYSFTKYIWKDDDTDVN
jgi:hypothetical protein